ncbi:MAG: DNA internalization-related competence protein ComEC/Rec2 [Syntrophobacteraceae bacterium]
MKGSKRNWPPWARESPESRNENGEGAPSLVRAPSICGIAAAFIVGIVAEQCCFPDAPPWLLAVLAATFLGAFSFASFQPQQPRASTPPGTGRNRFHLSIASFPAFLWRTAFGISFFFILGAASARMASPQLPAPASLEPFFEKKQTLFLAEVTSPPDYYPDKVRLWLRLHAAFTNDKESPVQGGVMLTFGQCWKPWFVGDRVLVRLGLERFHNFGNPGSYDYELAQGRRGLYARAYLHDDSLLVKTAQENLLFSFPMLDRALRYLETFRRDSLLRIQSSLNPDAACFYASLLLGCQHLLSDAWRDNLNRVGAIHLLSISGLHLGMVGLATYWLTKHLVRASFPWMLRRSSDQRIAFCAAITAAVLYALVSGLTLPTRRTIIMLLIYFGAFRLNRAPDPLSALATAAFVMLLLHPLDIFEVSFQFTFAAMLGMFVVLPKFQQFQFTASGRENGRSAAANTLLSMLRPFEYAFWTSVAANVMVLPLSIHYFYGLSLIGFAANTLLVPLVGFTVLPLGLTGLVLLGISDTLAVSVLKLGGWFVERSQDLIIWFSQFSWAYFWAGVTPIWGLALFYAGLVVLLSSWRKWSKALGIMTILALAWGASIVDGVLATPDSPSGTLQMTAVDVGQGSATLVRFPTRETMLVDGGGFYDNSFDVGRNVVAPFLWRLGIKRLDYVVLSHDHPDHRNGLRFIMEHFDVGEFWESGITQDPDGDILAGVALARKTPIKKLQEVTGGHRVGECEVDVLHPSPSFVSNEWDGKDLNDVSLVLRIRFGATHLLIPGDITGEVERRIFAEAEPLDGLLLIAPHHGSGRSSSPLLFERLHPRIMVFSCGYRNQHGFPAASILNRCEEYGVGFYRTDRNGAVSAISDGSRWVMHSQRP